LPNPIRLDIDRLFSRRCRLWFAPGLELTLVELDVEACGGEQPVGCQNSVRTREISDLQDEPFFWHPYTGNPNFHIFIFGLTCTISNLQRMEPFMELSGLKDASIPLAASNVSRPAPPVEVRRARS
jgi:hypothetical protein